MIFNLYSIRDVATGYLPPIAEQSEESAIRNFAFAVNRTDSMFFFRPSDYQLFLVGQFDTEIGLVTSLEHKLICDAVDLVKKEELR